MLFSQALEVAIGLVLVYYVLGAIVSWITKIVIEFQETRGKVLEVYLRKIAGKKTVDLINLPQMKAHQPIRYKTLLSVFGAATVAKKIEKVPVDTLVDSFFDLTGITGRPFADATELRGMISALPESEGRQAMLKWIDQGVTNINTLRSRINSYFTGLLDQAADKFKANARSFVIILSIFITLLLGTDSIQLAKDLWNNAQLRSLTVDQAGIVIQQGDENQELTSIISALDQLSIVKLGWWNLVDALPDDSSKLEWAGFILLKLLGLCITTVAVSQGSSFWYDVLKKISAPSVKTMVPSSSSEPEASG